MICSLPWRVTRCTSPHPCQVMALVEDQTSYYPFFTEAASHPRRGLNCGVVLYNLQVPAKLAKLPNSQAMRGEEYRGELDGDRMEALSQRWIQQFLLGKCN